MRAPDDFHCGHCGEEVSTNARGCAGCGARREGRQWFRPPGLDGLDLAGDDDFNYDEFAAKEFGRSVAGTPVPWRKVFWAVVAAITLVAFTFLAFLTHA